MWTGFMSSTRPCPRPVSTLVTRALSYCAVPHVTFSCALNVAFSLLSCVCSCCAVLCCAVLCCAVTPTVQRWLDSTSRDPQGEPSDPIEDFERAWGSCRGYGPDTAFRLQCERLLRELASVVQVSKRLDRIRTLSRPAA